MQYCLLKRGACLIRLVWGQEFFSGLVHRFNTANSSGRSYGFTFVSQKSDIDMNTSFDINSMWLGRGSVI